MRLDYNAASIGLESLPLDGHGRVTMESMKIVVIGAGAVGGWVGGRLAWGGHDVTLVGRQPLADAVKEGGLRLLAPEDVPEPSITVQDINVTTSIAGAAEHGPYDLAIFTVKTFDTDDAIAEMLNADLGHPTILSLQNGVRSEDELARAFGSQRVIAGTELNPISKPDAGTVLLEKSRGGIGLAPVVSDGQVEKWVRLFHETVLPTRAYADYQALKWSKLLLNLIGNASAAILDMSTTEVYANPDLFRLEIEMLREAVSVMRGAGLKPVPLPGYPVPLLAWSVRWAPTALLKPILRKLVAGGRGEKPPSLLYELQHGRRHSEVSDLNGAVVRGGEEHGLPTPVNRTLTEILMRLVQGRIQWANIRRQPDVLLAVATEMRRKARQT
jgi:2-dehydropantoate 2-reductase